MSGYTRQMPVVALRGMTVLPGMLIHFDVSRSFSIAAVEEAMRSNQEVLLIAQKDPDIAIPEEEDFYEVGTVSVVKQLIRMPGNLLRVMVSGQERGKLVSLSEKEPYYLAEVEIHPEEPIELKQQERDAMLRSMKDLLNVYFTENSQMNKDMLRQMLSSDSLEHMIEQLAVQIPMSMQEKQSLLEEYDLISRYERLAVILANEIEIIRIKKDIQSKVKERVDKNQKEYILREQMRVIREELGETNTTADADLYSERVEALEAKEEVKDRIRKEIERFKAIAGSSSESAVSRTYIETLLELPWDKAAKDREDITYAKKVLEEEHYGLEKVKDRILEFLAVRTLTKKGDSPIICLVGPPGTGKTSIARSVAQALNKKYIRICLGGVRDEAEIRGHRRTYIGALPGRLADGLRQAGVKNPLMLLDEIDKVSSDYKGDTASALLEVLDSEQNCHFTDHYIEIPLDLSEVLFLATANSTQTIPKPLLDRMEVIEVNSYTQNEKFHIAKEHLVKKQISRNGLTAKQLSISDGALRRIITGYTKEAGVRTLERKIGEICRKAARELLEQCETLKGIPAAALEETAAGIETKKTVKIRVSEKNLEKYLGKIKYREDHINKQDEIGIVRGLAWTSVGGDTLEIEVNTMKGKGKFELTGQLGDIMKESAKTGISYIRSVCQDFGVLEDYFEEHDIHIHIPEGAVPKDGPSAGITMATAMLSAVTGKKVRADVAMTGEITLRGRVLPIGGLKEKLLAAKTAGIRLALVPAENKSDVGELEAEITDGLEIRYVSTMEDVLSHALRD